MSYQNRLGTALDAHLTELAVLVGAANTAAGVGLTTTGYHIGALNLVAGVAVVIVALYQARRGRGGTE